MALAYVTHPVLVHDIGSGMDLHRRHEAVRRLFRQVHEWTGVDVARLLREGPAVELVRVAPVCQATLSLAIHDVLADRGIAPAVVGGMSVGNQIAACMAGAVDRQDLFTYLAHTSEAQQMRPRGRGLPPLEEGDGAGGEGATVIMTTIPYEEDPAHYVRGLGDGHLHLVSDMGAADSGRSARRVSIGGPRSHADRFIGQLPADDKPMAVTDVPLTPHCVLRQDYVDNVIEPLLASMRFHDPRIPVVSCLDPVTLTKAEEIRALFRDNHLRPASLPLITEGLQRHAVSAYLVVGPSMAGRMAGRVDPSVRFGEHSIPVMPVEDTEGLDTAVEMLYELGVLTASAS